MQNEELRHTQHELDASKALYVDLYDLAPVGYLTVSEHGLIQKANLSAAKMFNLERKNLLQKSISECIFSEDQNIYYLRRKRVINANDIESWDMRMTRSDGSPFWAHLLVTPACNGEIWINMTDITTRKQSEEDLRSYAKRLIEMEESLRKKLATELHDDIGRNLTAIGMNLAIINSNAAVETAAIISARIQDSERLVKEITSTARELMASLRPPVLDDFGLPAAIRWHADLFAKRTGIAVTVVTSEHFPRLETEQETALFRIAQEALMNAAKHAHSERVTVELQKGQSKIELKVADQGKGWIPSSPTQHRESSGWGMKIMRERAELIGGQFQVESAPHKGTLVSVVLPLEGM
ncbi:MAG: PAS domain S-box protein [Deltaproteobacteria bacterium]|nr:PAS domain S-box protein [Deltaproteobacteria bacterium]